MLCIYYAYRPSEPRLLIRRKLIALESVIYDPCGSRLALIAINASESTALHRPEIKNSVFV